jgi:hypothetical protein
VDEAVESSPGGRAIRRYLDRVLLLRVVEQETVHGPAPVSADGLAEAIDVQTADAPIPSDEPAAVEGDLGILGEELDDPLGSAAVEVPSKGLVQAADGVRVLEEGQLRGQPLDPLAQGPGFVGSRALCAGGRGCEHGGKRGARRAEERPTRGVRGVHVRLLSHLAPHQPRFRPKNSRTS